MFFLGFKNKSDDLAGCDHATHTITHHSGGITGERSVLERSGPFGLARPPWGLFGHHLTHLAHNTEHGHQHRHYHHHHYSSHHNDHGGLYQ